MVASFEISRVSHIVAMDAIVLVFAHWRREYDEVIVIKTAIRKCYQAFMLRTVVPTKSRLLNVVWQASSIDSDS